MKPFDAIKKYMKSFSQHGLSVFGKTYETDWVVARIFFVVAFVLMCVGAGIGYWSMVTSAFPQDLAPPVDTSVFQSEKKLIETTQTYMESKVTQFDAATGASSGGE